VKNPNRNSSSFSRRNFLKVSALGGAGILAGCQPVRPEGAGANLIMQNQAAQAADLPEITHQTLQTNGIQMHIAEAGKGFPVVFLHGFFDMWYSWHHQLPAVAAAGFHAIAPDQRGFGETDAPSEIKSYSMKYLAADIIGLLDALNLDQCALVAHDWGTAVAWNCATYYPDRIAAMFILSQQYSSRGDEPPTVSIAKFAGDHFNFALYFQEPGVAEAELDKDPRDTILRVFYSLSGDSPPGTIEYLFTEKLASTGILEGMPVPDKLPAWLTEADLDQFAGAFHHSGFRGGLNWYRNMDSDWQELPEVGATELKQPTSYMGGRKDATLVYAPIFDPMIANFPKLRKIIFVEDAGHWIQMESADEVNEELIHFLKNEFGSS